jgi:hypothetical protein
VASTVVFLWISGLAAHSPAALPARPSDAARLDLADFGAARGLSFRELSPTAGGSLGLSAYDSALADRLEAELEQARTALSALEEDAATERLSHVEADLLAHPHLPQAGFLMAECFALQAVLARPRDPELASELERARAALEGRRAAAFGDDSGGPVASPAPQSLAITGLSSADQLEIDGREFASQRRAELALGIHHVRVWRAERLVFASFLRVRADQTELQVPAEALTACSADDLRAVRPSELARGAPVPAGVACERWALARADGAGIAVALCERSRCGGFVHWERQRALPFTPISVERRWLPAWASFAIVGAAAAAAGSLVLWQAGAFDSGNPSAASFRYAGVNPRAIHF